MQNINDLENAFGKADDNFQKNIFQTLKNLSIDESRYVIRKPKLRIAAIAAVISILIIGSATALAVTGIIDFGALYNSIFANPEASQYVSTEDMIIITENNNNHVNKSITGFIENSDDLLIEPVAGFIDGECLYLQLKLTSQNENPIPDILYIIDGNMLVNVGDVAISHINEKTAIISFMSHIYNYGDTVVLQFNAISSMPISVESRPDAPSEEPDPVPVDSNEVSYVTLTENAITFLGNWKIEISADSFIEPRYIGSNFRGLVTEIRIQATSIEVSIYADDDVPFDLDNIDSRLPINLDEIESLVITLSDGRKIKPLLNGDMMDSIMISYGYFMEFIIPSDIIAIEFDGENLLLS